MRPIRFWKGEIFLVVVWMVVGVEIWSSLHKINIYQLDTAILFDKHRSTTSSMFALVIFSLKGQNIICIFYFYGFCQHS